MDPMLFIVVSVLVPSIMAMLALRYGADSRPPYRSSEHALALGGMSWDDTAAPTPMIINEPRIRLVSIDHAIAYPTLARIDGARDSNTVPFASDPQAARLEDRARELADAYWSDSVWLTGLVPATAFRKVCDALERERLAENRLVVLPVEPVMTELGARAG